MYYIRTRWAWLANTYAVPKDSIEAMFSRQAKEAQQLKSASRDTPPAAAAGSGKRKRESSSPTEEKEEVMVMVMWLLRLLNAPRSRRIRSDMTTRSAWRREAVTLRFFPLAHHNHRLITPPSLHCADLLTHMDTEKKKGFFPSSSRKKNKKQELSPSQSTHKITSFFFFYQNCPTLRKTTTVKPRLPVPSNLLSIVQCYHLLVIRTFLLLLFFLMYCTVQ
jgi:hypothetical protein